ncbi:hypothetical protein DRQ25_13840 [Candidatus Fermentibacteria bacterium]|nr:MAG: hypothetical protein DRQ25_13840 [Candidatus Fermentibacteria bacterium]
MIPAGMFSNIGRAGAARFFGNRTVLGAMGGAAWGAVSSDTSVIGGALMGAAGARYLGAGFKRAGLGGLRGGIGSYGRAFGRGVVNRARLDFRGARTLASQGKNRIQSTLKGW